MNFFFLNNQQILKFNFNTIVWYLSQFIYFDTNHLKWPSKVDRHFVTDFCVFFLLVNYQNSTNSRGNLSKYQMEL